MHRLTSHHVSDFAEVQAVARISPNLVNYYILQHAIHRTS